MEVKQYAKKLLDQLIELDHQTTRAYYEMGQIFASIQHGKLWQVLGYSSFKELVDEEMSFSPATAATYMGVFNHFKRLHYNKAEALNLLKKFGITHLRDVLPRIKTKVGERAIRHRIEDLDEYQINFTLSGAEMDQAHQALEKLGATMTDTGRYMNSSEAFMEMVARVLTNGQKKAA